MAETTGNPTPDRLAELERENARLAAEVAQVSLEKQALWRTLRAVAPGYVLTEAEVAAAIATRSRSPRSWRRPSGSSGQPMPPDSNDPFAVSWNGYGLERVRRLSAAAVGRGVGREWATTLRRIELQLTRDPRAGDPLYPLRSLELLVYRFITDRVEVVYAVHDTGPWSSCSD